MRTGRPQARWHDGRMQDQRPRPRFLVADDVQALADMVSELLREGGADVVGCAADGAEALRLFHATAPDGVVLDIEMPELNGFQVLRAIRASERDKRCLLIVLTAHSEPSMREQAYVDGADHFLHKASEFEHLLQIVPDFIRRHAG
jgi:chemosensory pili system protein ChpA (sensor histidine kinase/response regulator)